MLLNPKFSLGSFISSTFNFTEGMNRGRGLPASDQSSDTIIGEGTAGTVFEIPGSELAVKKGPNVDALWNDLRYCQQSVRRQMHANTLLEPSFLNQMYRKTKLSKPTFIERNQNQISGDSCVEMAQIHHVS